MKRKLIIALTAVLLVAFAIPAFAAITDAQKAEVDGLYQQMIEIRKEIIQKYVDAGEITPEQGKLMQERMDEMYEYKKSQGYDTPAGFGGGCGGGGMMGGPGMMGGYAPSNTGYEL